MGELKFLFRNIPYLWPLSLIQLNCPPTKFRQVSGTICRSDAIQVGRRGIRVTKIKKVEETASTDQEHLLLQGSIEFIVWLHGQEGNSPKAYTGPWAACTSTECQKSSSGVTATMNQQDAVMKPVSGNAKARGAP